MSATLATLFAVVLAPQLTPAAETTAPPDWLVTERPLPARVSTSESELRLENGLISRVFRLGPNAACVAFDDLMSGESLLRAVRPEARLTLDGEVFDVGGLSGQPNHAWLDEQWLDAMTADPRAFQFVGYEVGAPVERFPWGRTRHAAPDAAWPPAGVTLRLDFERGADAPSSLDGVRVSVHYELYDGIPALSKWLTVHNGSAQVLEVDRFQSEVLAVVEWGNSVEVREGVSLQPPTSLHVETDYAFGSFVHGSANRFAVHWRPDPEFKTQVNYLLQNPCLLVVEPTRGPDQLVAPGETFESFRTFELVHERRRGDDRERRGLALRRMYRTIAPWVTENPLILHVVSTDEATVKTAIDQAQECGFEMVSLSFGSGLSMEDDGGANLAKFAALAEYAAERGIQVGGYSLLSSRRIQPDTDNCVHPDTGEPGGQTHGFCPALASGWGQEYFRKLRAFFEGTGFLQFTHDGSYPGDFDASSRPPLQRGLDDSQWVQWRIITDFYKWLCARGAYVRVPDYYYLSGSNECGMGYREVNWSLPRAQQVIHTRQNIYDGTWEKTPSMGWMFVPLTQYHGGGAAATIEPLDEHLDHYERMLTSNLGLGVQAVYRGLRLYDTPRVRERVQHWTSWYVEHRDILESDLVHGRRADGRDLDWMLHANPRLETRGMLVVYNPLQREVQRTINVDLYYTGATESVRVRREGGAAEEFQLARDYSIDLEVTVPAGGMTWLTLQ
jgi:hypothetical protein